MPAAATSSTTADRNRANAQHSTGPATPEGKSRSARNASTHHAFSSAVVLPGEDEPRFRALRQSVLAGLNPHTAAELFLADRACALMWRLERCQHAEFTLDQDCRLDHEERIATYQQSHDTSQLDPELAACLDPDYIPPATFLAQAYSRPDAADNPFERLAKAEHRLHGMLNTTLRRLQSLRSDRHRQAQSDHPDGPCPYLDLDEDASQELQNEPSRRTTPAAPAPTGVPTSVGHANRHLETSKLQNEPTDNPRCPTVARPSTIAPTRGVHADDRPDAKTRDHAPEGRDRPLPLLRHGHGAQEGG